jgi:sigma-B regulation protein RsbU (phosphoserine phosphatase)
LTLRLVQRDPSDPPAESVTGLATRRHALPDVPDWELELDGPASLSPADRAWLLELAGTLVRQALTVRSLTGQLAARYEEIDLLYSIGELLGRSRSVDEVAAFILREVSSVVGARRAGLRVFDPARRVLRLVATLGGGPGFVPAEIAVDQSELVLARAFKSGRVEIGTQPEWVESELIAVPVIYAASGQTSRVVGTFSFAERAGGGSFTREETKLLMAVATQIGAALENARLVSEEADTKRLHHELHLAHELQLRLMPSPAILRGDADVSVRSDAADSVGGDFYTFARLGRGRIGVMLGDVASHGISAALIAAEVLAAAGIHANPATPPDITLNLLRDSLSEELSKTEMYLTIFYGILDPAAARLTYANAGHPYAFRVPAVGPAQRLDPTAPPLGLVEAGRFSRTVIDWSSRDDLLVLFTDGICDQQNAAGERFGEARIVALIAAARTDTPEHITETVFGEIQRFCGAAADDRTLLVLRVARAHT